MSQATRATWRRRLGVVAVAALSASAGWAFGHAGRDGPDLAPAALAAPVIAPSGSGLLRDDVSASAVHFEADTASCDSGEGEADAVDLEALELTLTYGTGSERYEAFVRALEAGVEIPQGLLWQVYATDLAEDTRLLALTTWADSVAADGAEVRAGLQGAAHDRSPAVRGEAGHRLEELDRYEQMRAEIAAQNLR